jgi:hypothetical protein
MRWWGEIPRGSTRRGGGRVVPPAAAITVSIPEMRNRRPRGGHYLPCSVERYSMSCRIRSRAMMLAISSETEFVGTVVNRSRL